MSYPKTQVAAARLARTIQSQTKSQIPNTEVATIVDITNHLTLGYVIGSTGNKGQVQIYGVPYGSVIAGMRVYYRNMASGNLKQAYFQAYAPAAQVGLQSGALMIDKKLSADTNLPSSGQAIAIPSGFTGSMGWFWSFFFYLSALPTDYAALFDMQFADGPSGEVVCLVDQNGFISLTYGIYTFQSTVPVSPHQIWHICWQLGVPGDATWQPLLINGYSLAQVTNASGGPGNGLITRPIGKLGTGAENISFTVTPGATTVQIDLLCEADGSVGLYIPPAGSWISKFVTGIGQNGSAPLRPINQLPTSDDMLPTGTAAAGQGINVLAKIPMNNYNALLHTLPDTSGNGNDFDIDLTVALVTSIGPY